MIENWKQKARYVRMGFAPTVNIFKQFDRSVTLLQDPYFTEAVVVLYSISLKSGILIQRISSMKRIIVVETQIEDIEKITCPIKSAHLLNEESALELVEFVDRKVKNAKDRDANLCWLIHYLGCRRSGVHRVENADNESFNVTKTSGVAVMCAKCVTAQIPLVYSERVLVDDETKLNSHTKGMSGAHKACEDGCDLYFYIELE